MLSLFVRRAPRRFAVALALAPSAGCALSTSDIARDNALATYSAAIQCPKERITAQLEPPLTGKPPSPEVAADPERLAIYNRQVAAEIDAKRGVDVTGCGHAAIYLCVLSTLSDSRRDYQEISCTTDMISKFGSILNADTSAVIILAAGGLAERAGLRLGDVYSALDHKPGTARSIVAELHANKKSPHVLTVLRAGVAVDIAVPAFEE